MRARWLVADSTVYPNFLFLQNNNANVKHSGEGVDAWTEASRLAGLGLINSSPDSTRTELRRVPRAHVHLGWTHEPQRSTLNQMKEPFPTVFSSLVIRSLRVRVTGW